MLWWVSSIVFCGTVLAAVWIKRDELQRQRLITGTVIILSIFFLSVAGFGSSAIYFLTMAETEISSLASTLKNQDELFRVELNDFFGTELRAFQVAMYIGAGSFTFVWLSLLYMWWKLPKELSSESPKEASSGRPLMNGRSVSKRSPASNAGDLFGLWLIRLLLRGPSAEWLVKPKRKQPDKRKGSP